MVENSARVRYIKCMASAAFRLLLLFALAAMPLGMSTGHAQAQPASTRVTAMADDCHQAPSDTPASDQMQMQCFAACTALAPLPVPVGWPEDLPASLIVATTATSYRDIVPDHATPPPRSV